MKLVAALLLLAMLALSHQQGLITLETSTRDKALGGHFFRCLADTIEDYLAFKKLVKDVRAHNWIGTIEQLVLVIKHTQDLMTNCKGIYCFGAGYKKCVTDNPGKFCELWGLLLYPQCIKGFINWDCCVCANKCPDGFRDDGLYCAKPGSYGRGAGYPLWSKDKCNNEHQDVGGCEKNGALYYPKCKPNYHNVGCCICSPNCPDGWSDIGVSCKKPQSYGRGTGYSVLFSCDKKNDHLDTPVIPNDSCQVQGQKIDQLLSFLDNETEKGQQIPDYEEDPNIYMDVKELGERAKKYYLECK